MMTSETIVSLAQAVAVVLVAAMVCATVLSAWHTWLAYKRLQLDAERRAAGGHPELDEPSGTGARIELAAVKERLRRLEAIASGVEL